MPFRIFYRYPHARREIRRALYLKELNRHSEYAAHLIKCRAIGVENNDRELAIWAQARITEDGGHES